MGRIAKVLSFLRSERHGAKVSDVKADPGGGPNITGVHFSAPGDDSYPLPGDYIDLDTDSGTGRESVVGYLDPSNAQKAEIGEKRIYSRNAGGSVMVELWLKNTGEAHLFNSNGYIKLNPDGEVEINGARITTSGDVITASGISLDEHIHNQANDSDGDSESPTDQPSMGA